MALEVISDLCEVDTTGGTIVVATDAVESNAAYPELESMDARNLAIKTAAGLGLSDPRISGNVDIAAVDAETGEALILNVPPGTNVRWQASIPVTRRLV